MRYRAVIFDLWQTLVPWPTQSAKAVQAELARAFGTEEPERFSEVWIRRRREREPGSARPAIANPAMVIHQNGRWRHNEPPRATSWPRVLRFVATLR